MSKEPTTKSTNCPGRFAAPIDAKPARRLRAQRQAGQTVWSGLGIGLVGSSVAIPSLLGGALGGWLDQRHADAHSWTLVLLVAGVMLGCSTAWHWVAKDDRVMREAARRDDH